MNIRYTWTKTWSAIKTLSNFVICTPALLAAGLAADVVGWSGTAQAADNAGEGGTVTFTDSNGLNPRSSPAYLGGYVVHSFTNSGTLIIPTTVTADLLVVGGGGGGGYGSGGGGGAGGVIYTNGFAVSGSVTVTVGGGGVGGTISTLNSNGMNSVFGILTGIGGGSGEYDRYNTLYVAAGSGGSGGGGAWDLHTAGLGTAGQGNNGGYGNSNPDYPGAGGGGAGAVGAGSNPSTGGGGAGGTGVTNSTTGNPVVYGGGGGGGTDYGRNASALGGAGGPGGGGSGSGVSGPATAGTANTGGGGGGGANGSASNNGASGGSGIVVVRYPYDSGALSVTVTVPANGQQFVAGSSISAMVMVANGTAPYAVTFYTNSGVAWSTNNASTNIFAINLGALAVGTYVSSATVTDSATPANATATSATNTFTVAGSAYLANLAISAGALTPAFSSNAFSYTAIVPLAINSITMTPTASDPLATIAVNGSAATSGSPFGPIGLNVGANVITTVIVSADTLATKTYTLTVTRTASTFTFTNTAAGTWAWTTAGNWDTNGVPISDTNVVVTLFPDTTTALGGAIAVNNDPSTLTLNALALNGRGPAAASTVTIGTAGNTWTFDGTTPTITLNGMDGGKQLAISVAPIIALNRNLTVTGNGSASASAFNLAGAITGNYGIVKNGSSMLTLSGGGTFSGGVALNAGGLCFGASGTYGTGTIIVAGNNANIAAVYGAYPVINNGLTVNAGVTVNFISGNPNNAIAFNGVVSSGDSNAVINFNGGKGGYPNSGMSGGAYLSFNNTANTFTGTFQNLGGGLVQVNSFADSASPIKLGGYATIAAAFQLGTGAVAPLVFNSRQIVLSVNNANTTAAILNANTNAANTITINTDLAVTANYAQTLALGGANTGNNAFNGKIVNGSGTLSLTKQDAGLWVLSGTNTYTGATTINAGILEIGGAGLLGGGTYTTNIANSGTFRYNSTATQTLSGVISGTGALIKNNIGTVTLAGTNTYSGATTINAGTLWGVTGGGCSNSAVTVTNTPGNMAALGVVVTNSATSWTCASLAFKTNGVGAQLQFNFAVAPSTTLAPLNVASNLTFAGAPVVVVDLPRAVAGIYPLLVVGGTVPATVPALSGVSGKLVWGGTGNKTLSLTIPTSGTMLMVQ